MIYLISDKINHLQMWRNSPWIFTLKLRKIHNRVIWINSLEFIKMLLSLFLKDGISIFKLFHLKIMSLMLCLIFESVYLYLWCQILAKFDVNQVWMTTRLFVYVPASDHKTDPSEKKKKKIYFVCWLVGLVKTVIWQQHSSIVYIK